MEMYLLIFRTHLWWNAKR